LPTRQWAVALFAQLSAQFFEKFLSSLGFYLLEAHSIHARRTVLFLREPVRLFQHVELPHVRVEAPEAMVGFRLRLLAYPFPQLLRTY